jgi:hypothetical protein
MPRHLPDKKRGATVLPWLVRRDRPDLALAEGPETRPSIRPGKDPPCWSLCRTVHRPARSRLRPLQTHHPNRRWPRLRKPLRAAPLPDIIPSSREIARARERNRHTPPVRDRLILRTGFCVLAALGIAQRTIDGPRALMRRARSRGRPDGRPPGAGARAANAKCELDHLPL